ncbi:MAG: hypothetical protein COU85_00430 [Candidatus Portnoybacteria bacterium CG10_big_fil_rev_8_21_14_0_10_44_7]|uniref:glucose-6-phosphate isomerase n=1 Tax=Candidatus Portnoybacteria bacterium CG10_big_fil_rev_8_21_14_0_10_44_7 TaxID=1974816 RepID=A0A2M8KJF2_9BACT|nr:MAG: hypothetical protein COU85_00430 [Candidatus Portnoybacteria bacterium CG10_big_fil_rev_8_21_14_0_10_44_7]
MEISFALKKENAAARQLGDLTDVIYDQNWLAATDKETPLYWMWRGLAETDGLRYDVLQFNDGALGRELMKTAGHGHSLVPGTQITHPELYQVLRGEVIYLLQEKKNNEIKRVISVYCQTGDFCLVPPNFEHVTVNLGGGQTLMANWVAIANQSNYQGIKQKRGGAYYGLTDTPVSWLKNTNYKNVPPLVDFPPTDFSTLSIDMKENMLYNKENSQVLHFLKAPQQYPRLWGALY